MQYSQKCFMKTTFVNIPTIEVPIAASPGFAKKGLSDFKLDIVGLCQFGCVYCSSNEGNYLRINRKKFAKLTKKQTGVGSLPAEDPQLMFLWPEIIERLEKQLAKVGPDFGAGKTLVFSMLTDGFSPYLVQTGTTEKALRMVLEKTQFRIRILTKNSIVGKPKWIDFFKSFPGRFVVGLSIGTMDNAWAKNVELRTSPPSSRLIAMQLLQDAGIATYGMLCPVFPEVLDGDHLERLVESIRPDRVEDFWAEPYYSPNDWRELLKAVPVGSATHKLLTNAFEKKQRGVWSRYATDLYLRLRAIAERDGWIHKLKYLLYETDIIPTDAVQFGDMEGVLLQSKPNEDGTSKNPAFAAIPRRSAKRRRRK